MQGIGAAIILPAALSIVMNMFDEGAERNKALGLWGAVGASGATFGVLAGGLLTRYVGLGVHLLPQRPDRRRRTSADAARRPGEPARHGARGVTTRSARCPSPRGLLLLVYAISNAPDVGWATARTISLLVVSAILLVAFVVIETRVEAPLMPLRIFELKTLAGANVVGFLLGASFFAFIFVGTLYMQQVLHYSAIETGLAWLATSVTSVAFAGLSQALVTRRSPKLVMALGMAMIGVGLLWTTPGGARALLERASSGRSSSPESARRSRSSRSRSPRSPASTSARPVSRRACINTSQQLGGALGVAVASTVTAAHVKTLTQQGETASAALAGGLQWALWVTGVTALVAVVATFLLVRSDELEQAVEAATATA